MKQQAYNESGVSLGMTDLSRSFHQELLKEEDKSWLREQNTKVMKQAIRQMLHSYDNFFKLHTGYPKFKAKKGRQSALFPLEAISKKNTFETRHITLTKGLTLKFRCSDLYLSRLREHRDRIRSATLSKTKSGNYFLSVLMDIPEHELVRFQHTRRHVGIDMGVKDFIVTSDGEVFGNKHFLKNAELKIKKLQKRLSRKKPASANSEKARVKLAKANERLCNQREAYIHEVANALLSENDIVFMEDLNVQGMLRNHKLARAIAEVGFYRFRSVLEDKASVNCKEVVRVGRWYASSKTCSVCGYVYKGLTLAERHWDCPVCGASHDRDANAAVNILMEGERIIGSRTPEYKPVERPTVDDRQTSALRSRVPAKQEVENPRFS